MPDPYAFWVAFYAAIVATAVAAWDIAKWRMQGPRLSIAVQSGMKMIGGDWHKQQELTYISVRVTNRGDRPTTLTAFTFALYENDWQAFANRRNIKFAAIIVDQSNIAPMPFVLAPGEQWSGLALQDEEVTDMALKGCLMCRVHHTHSDDPIQRQVRVTVTSAEGG